MRSINLITLLLVIIGGVNWLLVGIADFDLVAALFGGQQATLSKIVYVLVGISALWQLVPFSRAIQIGEPRSEAHLR
ncbi:uncharacterized membrane protein YuzA (DUF378 family) [Neorhizobium huautlense]|uniref:Uncharacterized membrane protein YuzA (DUF378 family) n=1 Tax=Neorhizobium huautlense TaxID=67774 RepID=A0ABT9Q1B9_9HYPH|nr:DUF378 domain-containing protein [Neorhizobium huautlense]MDP9840518.1 uncharacterized membrane protein YuzA (DUF378 family) [Neorhizobium huautlense]